MLPATRIAPPDWMTRPAATAVVAALGVARFVGGCVRDAVRGDRPQDIDIATPHDPGSVMARLAAASIRAVPTGIEHGTITAIVDGEPIEVTTLRHDVETDGRHARVAFTDDWTEDAQRRDFTINALYADADGTIYDPTGGLADLEAGIVRFIGDAARRIAEDHLRILRFFRFHGRYAKGPPDGQARAAIIAAAPLVARLSGERIAMETVRLLQMADPMEPVGLMIDWGVWGSIVAAPPQRDRLGRVARREAARDDIDPMRRLSALLPDDAGAVQQIAARLKLSVRDRDRLVAAAADDPGNWFTDARARRAACYRHGIQRVLDQAYRHADERALDAVRATAACWSRPRLPVGGKDVLARGVSGPAVGTVLAAVEEWWIDGDFAAGRDACLERLDAVIGA